MTDVIDVKVVCQSCAMPLENSSQHGSNSDGSMSLEYCSFCFRDGKFLDPNISMEEMKDKCIDIMVKGRILAKDKAIKLMGNTIPNLKRWKKINDCLMLRKTSKKN